MAAESELSDERRMKLAEKGRSLYGKFCGTGGRGICAESLAVYHLGRGEAVVVVDLIAFLEAEAGRLCEADTQGRYDATRGLTTRIRGHLQEATKDRPLTGPALRAFVLDSSSDSP